MASKISLLFFAYLGLAHSDSESQHPYIDLTLKPYFIDKSQLLSQVFGNGSYPHIYFTSPKHFGATSNLDMIDLFANIELDSSWEPKNYTETKSYEIFNQSRFGSRDIYRYTLHSHLAQHPVIYLNLGSSLPKNFSTQSMVKYLLHALQKAYKRYEWLLRLPPKQLDRGGNRTVSKEDIGFVDKLLLGRVNEAQVKDGLKILARILYKYFDRKVVVLIDSFDHALNSALFYAKPDPQTSQQQIFEAFKILNGMILKAFRYLPYTTSFMTGLSHAAVDLDLNLDYISHYNFLEFHQFVGYFGHTEDQLDRLLEQNEFPMSERNEITRYFNGHRIVDITTKLYSPHSIAQYFQNRRQDSKSFQVGLKHYFGLKPYFFGDEKNSALLKFIALPFFRNRLITLISGNVIEFCPIVHFEKIHYDHYYLLRNNNITFLNQYTESFADSLLLTMIMKMGYLCYNHDRNFTLPNPEIEAYVKDALTLFYAPANATFLEIGSLFFTILGTQNDTERDTLVSDFQTKLANLFTRLSTVNGYTRMNDAEYNHVVHEAIRKYQKDTGASASVWRSGKQLETLIVTHKVDKKTMGGVLQIGTNQRAVDVLAKLMKNVQPKIDKASITYFGVGVNEKAEVEIQTSVKGAAD